MSDFAPPAVQARLLRVLQRGFIEARNLALKGDCQQLRDLADTFELVPELMAHWNETTLGRIRSILAEYESSHPDSGYEYQSLLDVDETDFRRNGFNIASGQSGQAASS